MFVYILVWIAILLLIFRPDLLIDCILVVVLFKLVLKLIHHIINLIKNIIYNKRQITIQKEKQFQEEKWINDLRSQKQVRIGVCTIKCLNHTIIINDEAISIKDIQKLDFTNKLLRVWKYKIDTTDYVSNNTAEYLIDDGSSIRVLSPNWGKITSATRMTAQEYYDELKFNSSTKFYTYDFDKAYYISVILYDGTQKKYFIGNCYCYLEPHINPPGYSFSKDEAKLFQKMFNEINNCIFPTKK